MKRKTRKIMPIQLKELTDNELVELSEKFAMANLKDRDNIVFNFEEDFRKMIKKINLKKLIKDDKKYLKKVKEFIYQIILQAYLKDMINAGLRKENRYKRFYVAGN